MMLKKDKNGTMVEQPRSYMKKIFGHDTFRPLQKEAVEASLAGRDVLTILPTGGGKSLCYQLPALVRDGVTVVVSPLLALMVDQVRGLKLQGVAAQMIGSMQSGEEIAEVYAQLARGELKLLYVAPERFAAPGFVERLKEARVSAFVIDEAHCVSEWGHEFREDYRRLHRLRERFPEVPVSAFTATATKAVAEDIVRQLGMRDPVVLRGSVYRENLHITAAPRVGNGYKQVAEFLERFKGESGIVYTFTRRQAESLAEWLRSRGYKATAYHAGLSPEVRQKAYHDFIHDEAETVVATVAFGMGIDKSNIRYVVHTGMPKTLENYYQEIGRAGRDGLPSQTLLLYSAADYAQRLSLLEELEEGPYRRSVQDKLEKMAGFCRSEGCRHRQLAEYFGETMAECKERCDNCTAPARPKVDITEAARKFLSAVYRTGQRFGKGHLVDLLRGSENEKIRRFGHDRLSVYGIGKDLSARQWDAVAERLMEEGALMRDEHRALRLSERGVQLLRGERSLTILSERMAQRGGAVKGKKGPVYDLDTETETIFDTLRKIRRDIALKEEIPAYMVFGDKTLLEMARLRPADKAAMLAVGGVGEKKWERYGAAFVEAIKALEGEER